jgi:hypothetical protein
VVHDRGLDLTAHATVPDGRPAVVQGDELALEPYQYLWLRS